MNLKSKSGIIIVTLLSLFPLIIWLIVRNGTYGFDNFKTFAYSFGQIFALVGASMFALTFLLSTRIKSLEDYFGGLDKMYKFHHILGGLAFILILFHPLLLVVKYIPQDLKKAALFLLPDTNLNNWPYTLGIIALALMILLLVLTFFIKLQYQNWKFTHKFMGIVFLIAVFHIFFVTTDITFYPVLKYYMLFICNVGLISYGYIELIKPSIVKKYSYVIESIDNTKKDITSIILKPKSEKLFFTAGQFVYISFKSNKISPEQHPFTIASSPNNEGKIKLCIKSLGDYTSLLKNIIVGTEAEIEGPHGRFIYTNYSNISQIWIAGGIGITPFLSFSENLSNNKKFSKNIDLFYCTNSKDDAVFLDELKKYSSENNKLNIIPFYSNENGRINSEKIEKISGSFMGKQFFICGPPPMMESISNDLKNKGVPKKNIHFEEFNFK